MDELLGDFLNETAESLDLLDLELVRFEREPNNAGMLNTIFRPVHTFKGTCGFLGLPRLAKLAHAAETLMGQYRDGAPVTAEGVMRILESIDRIKQILAELERHGTSRRAPMPISSLCWRSSPMSAVLRETLATTFSIRRSYAAARMPCRKRATSRPPSRSAPGRPRLGRRMIRAIPSPMAAAPPMSAPRTAKRGAKRSG